MPRGRSRGLEHSAWMEFADGDGQGALPDVAASPARHLTTPADTLTAETSIDEVKKAIDAGGMS